MGCEEMENMRASPFLQRNDEPSIECERNPDREHAPEHQAWAPRNEQERAPRKRDAVKKRFNGLLHDSYGSLHYQPETRMGDIG